MVQSYRNTRRGFYTDCYQDTTPVGSIVNNFKTGANSYDHSFVNKATNTNRHDDISGNAYLNGDDPSYTHDGYLYCDGSTYSISEFPALYEIIGTSYGGRASGGIDVVNKGSGYTTSSVITLSAPPAGGTQATAIIRAVDGSGGITEVSTIIPGAGYQTNPTVTSVTGGTGATFVVRFDPSNGGILGINQANVWSQFGDQYLGTFNVPDLVTKKVVGNGPVFGNNSPTVGNISMQVGATGGAWYLDQDQQDNYFSLGRITTTGYDSVVETVQCTIIGSQTVKVTMENKKLPSIFQHSHTVFHSIPGDTTWPGFASGDRYVQGYRNDTGRLDRWYPTTGVVLEHKHALLRSPIVSTAVATYDFMDYKGGDEGVGAVKNLPNLQNATGTEYEPQPGYTTEIPYSDQYYLASGASNAGSYEFQTSIGNPTMIKHDANSIIGGRNVTTGGQPTYDFTQSWEYQNPGNYSINLSTVTGTPDKLIYELVGGGGSGAAGTTPGNSGQPTTMSCGSTLILSAGGGNGGGGSNGGNGGQPGQGGLATETGTASPVIATAGLNGGTGAGTEYPEITNPNDPGGGGVGGTSVSNNWISGDKGAGSAGCRVLTGGLSGQFNETLSADGSFGADASNPIPTSGITSVNFTLKGGRGGNGWSRGASTTENNAGGYGANVTLELLQTELVNFLSVPSPGWNVKIGYGANGRNGGTNSLSANGGYGGEGYGPGDGGGGGGCTILRRGTQIVAGAGGGGGGGADGQEGGGDNTSPGQAGGAYPGGAGLYQGLTYSSSGSIGAGAGGQGGPYGCVGGGGGAGGGGVSSGGTLPPGGGYGGGGAPGGPGGTPGGWGGHQGGVGGQQGLSEYKSTYFASGNLSEHSNTNGSANLTILYNANKWTSAGGGGGSGASWRGDVPWQSIGNPATIDITVGSGGPNVSGGSGNQGSTASGNNGYAKVGVGVITGWVGGNTTSPPGTEIESASQTADIHDVTINSNGNGTGTGGNFKLPTTQTPTLLFLGGGKSNNGTPNANGYVQTGTGHATGTVSLTSGVVSGLSLGTTAGTNQGYTEQPYAYILHGAGAGSFATTTFSSDSVDTINLGGTASAYTHFCKFGGAGQASNRDRWIVLFAQDTSTVNYFGIKCCRGNGVNGGDIPEEGLKVEYQLAGSATWVYIDTIINPAAERTDPLSGMIVPPCSQGLAFDGASGDTQWYTYSVALPAAAKAAGTKIRLYQERSEQGGTDNAGDVDHYGICEYIYFREKATTLVFVPAAGAIKRNTVDFLEYNVQGEVGPAYTYSSGLGCSDATVTLRSTTKVEPQAVIDPDYHVPLITPYVTCKYLIKAF